MGIFASLLILIAILITIILVLVINAIMDLFKFRESVYLGFHRILTVQVDISETV